MIKKYVSIVFIPCTSASGDEVVSDEDEKETDGTFFSNDKESKKPETFVQSELNDFVRDLGVSIYKSGYLAAILKKSLLSERVTASFYRDGDKSFRQYFIINEKSSLV